MKSTHADAKTENPVTTAPEKRTEAAPVFPPSVTEADMKAWVRREIALAANGASEAEREVLNP